MYILYILQFLNFLLILLQLRIQLYQKFLSVLCSLHLQNLLLIMNALRPKPHPTHQSVSEALENVKKLAPKETYFVHMSHNVGLHEEAEELLPSHVHFAYDGLTLHF